MTAALQLVAVDRVFDGPAPVHALRAVELEVQSGEHLAIVGPSGSGKSTLLNVLGLLDRPSCGRYSIEGADTTVMDEQRRSFVRASRIGFVFQSFHLLADRTIEENVAMAMLYNRVPRRLRRERVLEILEQVGLGHRVGFTPSTLSGGERQRVAIARAIVNRPAVLLCDEPTGNLDSSNASTVLDLLVEINQQGSTVVVITHDPDVARRAGRVRVMRDGVLAP